MAIEVSVGPPLVTINRGDTFVLAEPDGSIHPGTDQGMYSRDTRYVSNYEFFADGTTGFCRILCAVDLFIHRILWLVPAWPRR